jgi:hypothetical protein
MIGVRTLATCKNATAVAFPETTSATTLASFPASPVANVPMRMTTINNDKAKILDRHIVDLLICKVSEKNYRQITSRVI